MSHKEHSKRDKGKPRGRPFKKGNAKGKDANTLLDDSGHTSGFEGGIVEDSQPQNTAEKEEISKVNEKQILESKDNSLQEEGGRKEEKSSSDLVLIESIDFKNGDNTLSIRFSKKHNRMFRIQVFLNNESEIRPVTYTGASTGYAFWNLLKGALKK